MVRARLVQPRLALAEETADRPPLRRLRDFPERRALRRSKSSNFARFRCDVHCLCVAACDLFLRRCDVPQVAKKPDLQLNLVHRIRPNFFAECWQSIEYLQAIFQLLVSLGGVGHQSGPQLFADNPWRFHVPLQICFTQLGQLGLQFRVARLDKPPTLG